MAKFFSPLRYPGGKSKIYIKVRALIEQNAMGNRTYIEPFAGGFGIGISLLRENVVQAAVLNDLDTHIYNFWFSVLNRTDELARLIMDTPITFEEREKQKSIYKDMMSDGLSDGFATLFLNRVNYSGIIEGGPIGGTKQTGVYKLDCRFNKEEIVRRIKEIALLKKRITVSNSDASVLVKKYARSRNKKKKYFFNIDPPYVITGIRLYTNYFKEADHRNLGKTIAKYLQDIPWIVTYDECELVREIYGSYFMTDYEILHNAGGSAKGKEIVITNLPKDKFVW